MNKKRRKKRAYAKAYAIWMFVIILLASSAYAELEPGKLWINNVFIPYSVEEKVYDASISIATLKDIYKVDEKIELTDPPDGISFNETKINSNFFDDITINKNENNLNYDTSIQKLTKLSTEESQLPNYKGYIIEFKEKPVLEKKAELDEKAKKNDETSASLTKVAIVGPLLSRAYDVFALQEEDIQGKIEDYRKEIGDLHSTIKQKLLSELNKKEFVSKITGNVIAEQKDELVVLGEYKTAFNGIALDIFDDEAEKLKKVSEVKEVYPNYEVHTTLMDSVPLINADDVWLLDEDGNNCAETGKECLTGKDITIAIIDTGVDYTHPDLGGCFGAGCKVIGGYDLVNNDNNPIDDMGHGTHVAATAAGNGDWNKNGIVESNEGLNGVAPDAKIYAIKVLNSGGSGSWETVIGGIERAVDPNQDENFDDHVDVISMSLGGPGNPDDPVSKAIDNVVDNGVVAVIAAGNSGPNPETIGSPGTARKAITVGAVNKFDNIAVFSSKGPVIWEDEEGNEKSIIKPDIVAPGVLICAARMPTFYPWNSNPTYQKCLDNNHVLLSGTSMATPHVTGAVALLKQKNPDWTPEEIKAALKNTGVDINTLGRERRTLRNTIININTQGYGRIDVLNAINSERPLIAELKLLNYILSEKVDIIGTAKGEGFDYYELFYEKEGTNNWNLICSNNKIIEEGVLCSDFNPDNLLDGEYNLRLIVHGIQEQKSEDRTIFKIDFVNIQEPMNNDIYRGGDLITLTGNIKEGFDNYFVEFKKVEDLNWLRNGINFEGTKSVKDNVFATWYSSGLGRGFYDLRLTVNYNQGVVEEYVKEIYLDPTLKEGWPVKTDKRYIFATTPEPIFLDINNDGKKEIIIKEPGSATSGPDPYWIPYDYKGELIDNWRPSYPEGRDLIGMNQFIVDDIDDNGEYNLISGIFSKINILDVSSMEIMKFYQLPKDAWPTEEMVVSDLNGDGVEEIIFTAGWWPWDGKEYKDLYVVDSKNLNLLWSRNIFTGNSFLAVGDITGNGKKEIVLVSETSDPQFGSKISIYDFEGNFLNGWVGKNFRGKFGGQPILIDINGDNKLEVFMSTGDSINLWDYRGDYVPGWPIYDVSMQTPAVGYINGNIVFFGLEPIRFFGGGDTFYAYNSDGTPLKGDWPKENFKKGNVLLIDVNGDNNVDIVASSSYSNKVYAWNSNGDLISGFPKLLDDMVMSFAIDDADADGFLDLSAISGAGSIYLWKLDAPYNPSTMEWPIFQHDPQHTSNYHFSKRPQSKIVNNENYDLNGNLIIKIQKKGNSVWTKAFGIVIPANGLLKLDKIFNPIGFTPMEIGEYKVIAEFMDKYGNIIQTKDGKLRAEWEFRVTG